MLSLPKTLPLSESAEPSERRGGVRYQITVSADVVEIKSGTRFSTRTTDLGPGGCFVDTLMPLPVGSVVRARLYKDNVSIDARGVVTFSQAGLGMGIAFDEMTPEKASALNAWIVELMQPSSSAQVSIRNTSEKSNENGGSQGAELTNRLIRLLVKRGVISEHDAAALLKDPVL